MKKVVLGITLFSTLLLANPGQGFADKVSDKADQTQTEIIKKSNVDSIFTVDNKKININGTGKISLKPVYGVKLEGKFESLKNENLELKSDGTYTGLKTGKTTISPVFNLTDESFKDLEKVYQEKTGNQLDKEQPLKMSPVEIEVTNKKQVELKLSDEFQIDQKVLAVGDVAKVKRASINGVEVKGTFKTQKSDIANLKEDGTLTALKEGADTLKIDFELSQESEQAIKKAYIKESSDKELKESDITLLETDKNSELKFEVKQAAPIEETTETTSETVKEESGTSKEETEETEETSEVTPTKQVDYSIKKEYVTDKSSYKVGETGKVSVKAIDGVELKGEFKSLTNDFVKLSSTGELTILKAGTTQITPEFILSDTSKKELKQNYIKSSGNSELKEADVNLVETNDSSAISLTIAKKDEVKKEKIKVDVTPDYKISGTKFTLGSIGGKVTVNPIQGVQPKGKFKTEKHTMFELKEDGSFIGHQAGTVEFYPSFEISKESLNEIGAAVLKQKGNEGRTIEDIEFIRKDIQKSFKVEFAAKTDNKGKGKLGPAGKKYVPATKKYEPVKTLPQTGESKGVLLILLGSLTTVGSAIFLRSRFK